MPVPGHKILTFSSRLEHESGGETTRLAMNPDSFVVDKYAGRCPDVIDPIGNSSVILFTWKLK